MQIDKEKVNSSIRVYKLCSKCKEENNSSSSYCKSCKNTYQKNYYKNNPASIDASATRRRAAIRNLIIKAKDNPCFDCGLRYPYFVMDLDHVRGDKEFCLSVTSSKLRSLEAVKKKLINAKLFVLIVTVLELFLKTLDLFEIPVL